MTKPQSEAERMASEFIRLGVFTEAESCIWLAGFKAAVEQAEKLKYHYSSGLKYIAVEDLKALLEPKS